jgi:uncharacterized protein GlcG (DUF336 family)
VRSFNGGHAIGSRIRASSWLCPPYDAILPRRRQSGHATREECIMTMPLFRLAAAALGTICASALIAPAHAQLLQHKDLTAAIAMAIAETAQATCKANGYSVSVTVVGRLGEVILQLRGDDSNPHTMENSFRKAYTARTTRAPSGAMVDRVKADPTLGLVNLSNIIAIRGALPIKVGDEVIGAAGASGAPGGEKDEACVQAALDKIADRLK